MKILLLDGEVRDIPESIARVLINAGKAFEMDSKVETAMESPAPENASADPLKS